MNESRTLPHTIGRFEVESLLGTGAFGQVYAARDPLLSRPVAIKVLHSHLSDDPSLTNRFAQEASSLASLTHPNIAVLFDLVRESGRLCMVMELLSGLTLRQELNRLARIPLQEALAIVDQIANGLHYVHQQGIIHRDIKPSNLMLTKGGTVKIMDFGVARASGTNRLTTIGGIVGTLKYLAPEQIRGEDADARSDIYSLGCVLYEMLSGSPPFNHKNEFALIQAHLNENALLLSSKLSGLPPEIDRVVQRMLAKSPTDRFATVDEFVRALRAEQQKRIGVTIVQGRDATVPSAPRATVNRVHEIRGERSKRIRLLSHGLAATAVIAATGLIYSYDGRWLSFTPAPPLAASNPLETALVTPPATQPPDPQPPTLQPSFPQPPAIQAPTLLQPPAREQPAPPETVIPSPAYAGRALDWLGAGTILVPGETGQAVRFLRLTGIRDVIGNQEEATRIRGHLNAYLHERGGVITCFDRHQTDNAISYQCYTNGQDIALWAIRNHLGNATNDAPGQYRTVSGTQ